MNPLKKIKTFEELKALSPILIKLSARCCRSKLNGIIFDNSLAKNDRYLFKLITNNNGKFEYNAPGWWVSLFHKGKYSYFFNDMLFFKNNKIL